MCSEPPVCTCHAASTCPEDALACKPKNLRRARKWGTPKRWLGEGARVFWTQGPKVSKSLSLAPSKSCVLHQCSPCCTSAKGFSLLKPERPFAPSANQSREFPHVWALSQALCFASLELSICSLHSMLLRLNTASYWLLHGSSCRALQWHKLLSFSPAHTQMQAATCCTRQTCALWAVTQQAKHGRPIFIEWWY